MELPFRHTLLAPWITDGRAHLAIGPDVVPVRGDARWSVRSATLRGGMRDGVDVVEVDNGLLSFSVLPTRGMGIWKGRCGRLRLGWDSPVAEPVHPSLVNSEERGGLGWLRGFNEWIVRCGLGSMGAPGPDTMTDNNGNTAETFLPLHGHIANTPAHTVSVEVAEEGIVVRGVVDEAYMFGPVLRLTTEIRTGFYSNELEIRDTVTNRSANPAEYQLLYHANYGAPLLEAGAQLVAPSTRVAPRDPQAAGAVADYATYGAPTPGFVEEAFWHELAGRQGTGETLVLLRDAAGENGASLRFSLEALPCFTQWRNTADRADGYVTGLEPATGFPNPRRFEREKGRVPVLGPGESRTTSLVAAAHTDAESVAAVAKAVAKLVPPDGPRVDTVPQPDWSPV